VHDLVSQGRWDEAHGVLVRWAMQQPEDADAQLQCGSLSYTIGRFQDSERYLRQALAKRDTPEAHYFLGLALSKLNRHQEAMAEFREACERKEGFATGHLHWGVALLQMGSFRGALGQFRQALKLNPRLVAAAYQAGIAAYQLGQYSDAVEFFAEACEKDPTLAEAFNGLGVALCALTQYDKAIVCFQRARDINPNLAIVLRNWAAALINMGNLDEAIKRYQDAVNLPPKVLEAKERALVYNDWGVNLFRQGRAEESAERLLHAVSIDPGFLDARLNLGIVENSLQEYEQAAEHFSKALEIDSQHAATNMHMGISSFLLGRYDEAIKHLEVARASEPSNSALEVWLGYARMAVGDHHAAEQHFRSVIDRNPDSFIALDALGCCLTFQQRYEDAVVAFKQCLKVNNQFGLAHIHLARALEASGRGNEAALEFRVAVQKDPSCLLPEKEILEELIDHAGYDIALSKSQRLLQYVPNDEDALLALAKALRAQGRLDEASKILEGLVAHYPKNGQAHILQGHIFLSKGMLLEADDKFRSASLLCDGDVTLFYGWGKTLGLLGLHELALEKFQKANEIDPYDSDTYEAWGATLKALGRYPEAAEIYKRASEYV
jgi:tetratricopeptide (TPR) repeat protein